MAITAPQLIIPYFVLWATLVRSLLVATKVLPPTCGRCGMNLERRSLGDEICRCH
jgi:hypothetical protein